MMEEDPKENTPSSTPPLHQRPSNQSELPVQADHNALEANELNLEDLFELRKDAVFLVLTSDDESNYQGTGFFVDSQGLAVSNYHVFEGTRVGSELIQTYDGNTYQIATVIERDKELDYIIFRVRSIQNSPFIPLANSSSRVGESVFAIGNPRGLTHTLSTGIISSYRENDQLIQTTTEITYGSSGGALINMKGEVIGITTSGIGEANLNFAVNIEKLRLERFVD